MVVRRRRPSRLAAEENLRSVQRGDGHPQAAVEGLGLWLAPGNPRFGRDPATSSGALVLAYPFHAFTYQRGYYLACRPHSTNAAAIELFRNWILNADLSADPA